MAKHTLKILRCEHRKIFKVCLAILPFSSQNLYNRISLISRITQLFLIQVRKFYCFRLGPDIFYKYARHKYLHCLMMGEVTLETWFH